MQQSTFVPALFIAAIMCPLVGIDITHAAGPVVIATDNTLPNLRQPQATVSNSGNVFVTFGAGETIYVCKSIDRGKSFSTPVKVGKVPKLALGMRRGPRIVASDDCVVITAISHDSGDVLAWRSLDSGESWSESKKVNDQARSAREGLHDLSVGNDGLLFCTWLDLRNGRTQVYGTRSTDSGNSWDKNLLVYASPSGTVCECCHPSVVVDKNRAVHVMWRNLIDGNRDMYLATSEDGGQSFGSAEKLGNATWKLNACPMDGGDMAVRPSGDLLTVWRRDRNLYTAKTATEQEKFLAPGEQPSIVATSDGDFISWVDRRGGNLLLLGPTSTNPLTIASKASDPVLAAAISGDGPVVLLWESKDGNQSSIQSLLLND